METVERLEFRYTNRFICYLIQALGMTLFAVIFYSIFNVTATRHISSILILYPFILIIYDVISFIIIASIPMLIGIKISDKYGYADFYSDRVVMSFSFRKITINYVDVKQVDWYWIQFGKRNQNKMKNYRLKVKKAFRNITIAASMMETNDIAKSDEQLSLKAIYEKLRLGTE